MALETKQDVNNEQWQPLQADWLRVTDVRVCARTRCRGRERDVQCVRVCAQVGVCVHVWKNFRGC